MARPGEWRRHGKDIDNSPDDTINNPINSRKHGTDNINTSTTSLSKVLNLLLDSITESLFKAENIYILLKILLVCIALVLVSVLFKVISGYYRKRKTYEQMERTDPNRLFHKSVTGNINSK